MILEQIYLGCLAQASYLIGDRSSATAVIVDPRRDIDEYLDLAGRHGLRITHAILTHFHADFVAGHIELRNRAGARIALGARAEADYDFLPLADGDTLELGSVRLAVLATPGHTPEAISILVYDLERDAGRPHAVLTGDTMFIGDVGRPDLMASQGVSAEELARRLYRSLRTRLLPLPDETLVYPGHGAGSLCGRALSSQTVSTIGEQRAYNYALQPMTEEAFLQLITADQLPAPAYFALDADLNRREHQTLDAALEQELRPLALEDVLRLERDQFAQLLDCREAGQFAAAHVRRACNIGLGGQYAAWAGALLDRERPLVVIAEPGTETEAVVRLGRIGFDNVAGYLDGGMAALADRADLVASFTRLAPATLAERLSEAPAFVLDVRRQPEVDAGRLEVSRHIELSELPGRLEELPREQPLIVYCAGGYRSAIAVSLLLRHGFDEVSDLAGGYAAWEAAAAPPQSRSKAT